MLDKRATLMANRHFLIAQSLIPLKHPLRRVAAVKRDGNAFNAEVYQFPLSRFQQNFAHLAAAIVFVHPKGVNQGVGLAIDRSVFCVNGDAGLNAAVMLLIRDENVGGIAPMLILNHFLVFSVEKKRAVVYAVFLPELTSAPVSVNYVVRRQR